MQANKNQDYGYLADGVDNWQLHKAFKPCSKVIALG